MLCRRVWHGAENAREATTLVRDLYDNLRKRYEIGTTYAPPTLDGKFEILVGTPRQATSYGDMRRVVYDN